VVRGSKCYLKVIIRVGRTWMYMAVAMISSLEGWRFSDEGVLTL